jgi:hypothetical protein
MPEVGLVAANEAGLVLDRVALVPKPGPDLVAVAAGWAGAGRGPRHTAVSGGGLAASVAQGSRPRDAAVAWLTPVAAAHPPLRCSARPVIAITGTDKTWSLTAGVPVTGGPARGQWMSSTLDGHSSGCPGVGLLIGTSGLAIFALMGPFGADT